MTPRQQILAKYPNVSIKKDWSTGGHKAFDGKAVLAYGWGTNNGNPTDAWNALHYDMTHGHITGYSL